jgi:hypothetical protein
MNYAKNESLKILHLGAKPIFTPKEANVATMWQQCGAKCGINVFFLN